MLCKDFSVHRFHPPSEHNFNTYRAMVVVIVRTKKDETKSGIPSCAKCSKSEAHYRTPCEPTATTAAALFAAAPIANSGAASAARPNLESQARGGRGATTTIETNCPNRCTTQRGDRESAAMAFILYFSNTNGALLREWCIGHGHNEGRVALAAATLAVLQQLQDNTRSFAPGADRVSSLVRVRNLIVRRNNRFVAVCGCCCWEGPHVRVNVRLARLPRPRRHQRHGAVIKVETNRTQTCLLLLLLLLGVHRHVPGRLYKCTSPDVNNTAGVRQLPRADGMMEFLGKANAKK